MKNLTFLKAILAIFAVIVMTIGLNSCGGKKANKPDCEKNNTGSVIVTNNTGEVIYVDVSTSDNHYINDERRLANGAKTTYDIPVGNDIAWGIPASVWTGNSSDDYSWYQLPVTVEQCKTYNVSWTIVYTKGSNILSTQNAKAVSAFK